MSTEVAGGIITLEEAQRGLNYAVKSYAPGEQLDARDLVLVSHIKSATELVEKRIGSVLPRIRVQIADGGRSGILLNDRLRGDDPEVTVTANGAQVPGVLVDVDARIIYPGTGGTFAAGQRNIKISYPAGYERDAVPELIRSAIIDIVVTWAQQKQATVPDFDAAGDASDGAVKMGFAMPRRAAEKLAAFRLDGSEFA